LICCQCKGGNFLLGGRFSASDPCVPGDWAASGGRPDSGVRVASAAGGKFAPRYLAQAARTNKQKAMPVGVIKLSFSIKLLLDYDALNLGQVKMTINIKNVSVSQNHW